MTTVVDGRAARRTSVGPSLRPVLGPWLVSRFLAAAIIIGARSYPFDGAIRFAGFFRWDGGFYLHIARYGYGPPPVEGTLSAWPFFPLLPALIRAIDGLGLPERAGIIVVNQLAVLAAMAGLWQVVAGRWSPRVASLAVWALALFPASFVLSMAYPSALFLASSVWAFVLVEQRRDVSDLAAGTLGAVAAMARPNGFVAAVALAIAARSVRRAVIVAGPAFGALAVWSVLCWRWTGNPFVFWASKSAWIELDVWDVLRWEAKVSVIPHLVLGLAAIVVVLWQRQRLPASWTLFTLLDLVPPLALGIVGMGRYAAECFPAFVAAGLVLAGWATSVRYLVFALGAGGMVVTGVSVIRFTLVP